MSVLRVNTYKIQIKLGLFACKRNSFLITFYLFSWFLIIYYFLVQKM